MFLRMLLLECREQWRQDYHRSELLCLEKRLHLRLLAMYVGGAVQCKSR